MRLALLQDPNQKSKPRSFSGSVEVQNLGFLAETYSFLTIWMLKLFRMKFALIEANVSIDDRSYVTLVCHYQCRVASSVVYRPVGLF